MKLGNATRLLALVTPFALFGAPLHRLADHQSIERRSDVDGSSLTTDDDERARAERNEAPGVTGAEERDGRAEQKEAKQSSPDKKAADKKAADKKASGGGDATKKNEAQATKKKVAEPKPLPGKTIDFAYDAKDVKVPSRAYLGRVFVHDQVVDAKKPMPIVIFIHGLNKALIKYRWMGGGEEGDVRRIVSDLIDEGKIPPVLLAAPSSIQPDAVSHDASFPVFDFDQFVDLTEKSLDGVAVIDRSRIIVAGHSGAGCSSGGGIVAAVRAKLVPRSVISIDTCMGPDLAKTLSKAPSQTNVVVTWQTATWDRNFDTFSATFRKGVVDNPADEGVLRELDALPALARAHDATVSQTFGKYLPQLLQ